jgi:hypothetical protein
MVVKSAGQSMEKSTKRYQFVIKEISVSLDKPGDLGSGLWITLWITNVVRITRKPPKWT